MSNAFPLIRTCCIATSTLLVLIGTAACGTVATPETAPLTTNVPAATLEATVSAESEPLTKSISTPDPTLSPTTEQIQPTPPTKVVPPAATLFPAGDPPSQVRTIPLIASTYAELEAVLPWSQGELTTDERSNLAKLSDLFDQDRSSALTLAEFLWIQDGVSRVEKNAVQYLADMASEGIDLGPLIAALWVIDGIDHVESKLLLETRDIARKDSKLAATIIRFPWISDGVQRDEPEAVGAIGDLVTVDPLFAPTVRGFDWTADGIDPREQELLNFWTSQAKLDISYADQLMTMPAFGTSVERLDLQAAYSLTGLRNDFPSEYKELSQVPWFSKGIDDANAPLVYALARQARFGKYFNDLLGDHRTESLVFTTPKGVEVTAYSYIYQGGSGLSFLRRMEDAIAAMEDLVGAPFPREEIIYVFALPGEVEFIGLNMGTHMLMKWEYAGSVPNELTLGVLAFNYWNSRYSGTTHAKGPPFWFEQGALDFMSNYALDQLGLTTLDQHKSFVENLAKYCGSRAVSNIQDLIEHLEQNGIETHRTSHQAPCNKLLGEIFFLNLHEAMGHEAFSQAWSEIYALTQSSDGPVSEEQIYRAFIGNADTSSLEHVKNVYQKWHGGEFSQ